MNSNNTIYGDLLFKLGWHQISTTMFSIENDFLENKIYIDFGNNIKGIVSCNDKDGQPIKEDIIEEFDVVAIFRKKQEEIDIGVPQHSWELRR